MKKYVIICLLFAALPALCTVPSFGCKTLLETMEIQSKRLTLTGKLDNMYMQKSAPAKPQQQQVQVTQSSTALEFLFLSNLGNLTLTVINQQGFPVYQRTVNATSGGTFLISTLSWSAGSYVIMITNGMGGYLEGTFEIQ